MAKRRGFTLAGVDVRSNAQLLKVAGVRISKETFPSARGW
jgi:hypothetical protein